MADFQLNVSIDVLKSKADEITAQITRIERNWNNLCSLVNASKGYWEGEAGNYHRKILADNTEDFQTILKRLKEHPRDLLNMAGVYQSAEDTAANIANELRADVIK